MTYGLGSNLFIENGPTLQARRRRPTAARSWLALPAETRLALVEGALRPAAADGFPLAL